MRPALEAVLADLDRDDAAAAFRAIAFVQPGGLGDAPAEDVRRPPSVGLREAMALAAVRDSIARQYANGFADLFEIALPHLPVGSDHPTTPCSASIWPCWPACPIHTLFENTARPWHRLS